MYLDPDECRAAERTVEEQRHDASVRRHFQAGKITILIAEMSGMCPGSHYLRRIIESAEQSVFVKIERLGATVVG
jgi:hypothetical protein